MIMIKLLNNGSLSTFFVEAEDDDAALRKATSTLKYGKSDVTWAWIYTTKLKEIE